MDFNDDIMPDSVPATSDVDYPCTVCGKEAGPYAGKGRRPTKCPDHKTSASKRTSSVRVTGADAVLAAKAAEALCQINGFAALGAMMLGFVQTGAVIQAEQSDFKEQAYNALLTDADLCRTILKGGVKSGKLALLIAYAMLAASIFPTAKMEFAEKKEERAKRRAELAEADL